MQTYLQFLNDILTQGQKSPDRTGTGTISHFGYDMRFDIRNKFPLLTTKKIHLKSVIHELLWFIQGSTNIHYLKENGVRIWNEWADESGELGPVYGAQWRSWKTSNGESIDQLQRLIEQLKSNPHSRRHILSAWNVGSLSAMALPPCHLLCQFYVTQQGELSCKLTQRSADAFLGVPFNIASYSLLTYMIAQVTHLKPGDFIWSGGDCHIYLNHLDQVKQQLQRTPTSLPTCSLNPNITHIDDFCYDDVTIHNYNPQSAIKAPIAV